MPKTKTTYIVQIRSSYKRLNGKLPLWDDDLGQPDKSKKTMVGALEWITLRKKATSEGRGLPRDYRYRVVEIRRKEYTIKNTEGFRAQTL